MKNSSNGSARLPYSLRKSLTLPWGRYRASVNVLKLDTNVNNIATRECEETVESSRPKPNQWPPALQENNSLPLRWGLAFASLGKRAGARLFGYKRESRGKQEIQNSEQPLPCKSRNACRFAGGLASASLGRRADARQIIYSPAGSIPRRLRRIRIENVFASGSFSSRVRSGVIQ